MHCLDFRPNFRVRSNGSSSPLAVPKEPQEGTENAKPRGTPPFSTKEERLAFVEEHRSLIVNVFVDSAVLLHFNDRTEKCDRGSGGTALAAVDNVGSLSLSVSVGTQHTTASALNLIFERLLALRRVIGADSTGIVLTSKYFRVARGVDVPMAARKQLFAHVASEAEQRKIVGAALLLSDLELSVVDADGRTVKPLRRMISNKNNQPLEKTSSSVNSVAQLARALMLRECEETGKTFSQKPLYLLIATAKESDELGDAEARFSPPYFLSVCIGSSREKMRTLMEEEAKARVGLEERQWWFLHRFAVPYERNIITPDTRLRVDWILYQSHCRHKLHCLEVQARIFAQQRTTFRSETAGRRSIEQEYDDSVLAQLQPQKTILEFMACWSSSRECLVLAAEAAARGRLASAAVNEADHCRRMDTLRADAAIFIDVVEPQWANEVWTAMLGELHRAMVALEHRRRLVNH